jgi:hypothetical protein
MGAACSHAPRLAPRAPCPVPRAPRVPVTDGRAPAPEDIDVIMEKVGAGGGKTWESGKAGGRQGRKAGRRECRRAGRWLLRVRIPSDSPRPRTSPAPRPILLTCGAGLMPPPTRHRQVRAAGLASPMIFNCQLGAGRTTTGTVIGGLISMYAAAGAAAAAAQPPDARAAPGGAAAPMRASSGGGTGPGPGSGLAVLNMLRKGSGGARPELPASALHDAMQGGSPRSGACAVLLSGGPGGAASASARPWLNPMHSAPAVPPPAPMHCSPPTRPPARRPTHAAPQRTTSATATRSRRSPPRGT